MLQPVRIMVLYGRNQGVSTPQASLVNNLNLLLLLLLLSLAHASTRCNMTISSLNLPFISELCKKALVQGPPVRSVVVGSNSCHPRVPRFDDLDCKHAFLPLAAAAGLAVSKAQTRKTFTVQP